MLKAGYSSTASESTLKPRSIKFSDPFATKSCSPSMANRSITTQPVAPSRGVRRSNTVGVGSSRFPRPARGSTIDVQGRPVVGKAAPSAQFEMVSPPRSPKDTNPRKGSQLPLRAKSAEPSDGMRRTVTVTRGLRRNAHEPNTTAISLASGSRSSMLSVRRDPLVMGWAESQANFKALTGTAASQNSDLHWQSTTSTVPPDPTTEAERRRADSEPEVQSGLSSYPHLTPEEGIILVRKLRALLKYVGIEDQALVAKSSVKEAPTDNSVGSVFGRSVKNSSLYASCQVVLGQHSHNLPICVFASVEEICQRGIAAPGLFRVTPSPNERTVEKLAREFDQGPSYGARMSLAKEGTSNICALLKLYLRALPEALLSGGLWPIVQKLTLVRRNDGKTTSAQIAAIQAILHLQHPTSFSLFVYLLAFMHQLVLHGSQNGLTIPMLAGIFGPALFSPRKGNSARTGCVMSPPPESQVLVKTFQSARDVAEGTRVMTWVLEHWDGIATGLLSLDIVHGSEKDIPAWEANLLRGSLGLFRGESDGQYSEGPSIDEIVDPALDNLIEFPLPEEITIDRVPVREVRNCIVAEVPPSHSTRASSPATLWSQETGPNPTMVSRTASLETAKTTLEPAYVQELRRRMDNQETQLANLRQELALIRNRFVFPLPPNDTPQEIKGNAQVDKPDVPNADIDEDTMVTPRPPSGPRCPEFQTMNELIDSLDSKPVTPLFHKTLAVNIPDNELESGGADPTSPMDDARQPRETSSSSATSDSGPDTPPNEPAQRTLCVVNPDSGSEKDVELVDGGRLQELLAARDALRSALAAMDPVRAQLKVVEEELEHRGESNIP
ncbi:unnamed protein product [Rhizoctonia solani]|uniref:Rho-GAP domain-containing protein n=1 Tax=Rhizoctonia solani TaxID=456999 RepID=A0A8H3C2I3_9AGAM|nr:unnamed protein product [Rhizoctonia solani]